MNAISVDRDSEPVGIIVAEDNEFDRMILQEAFEELGMNVALRFVRHGEELLELLHGTEASTAAEAKARPLIVIMDLNMPRMDGNEALRRIRQDTRLRRLPVVILSTSDNPKQITEAYDNGANAFMTKPGRFEDMVTMLRSFRSFWLDEAHLPTID